MSQQSKFSIDVLKSLQSVYGGDLERVVQALKTPGKRYCFRANTIKTSPDELVERFERRGLSVKKHPAIEEAVYLDIDGPFEIPIYKQKIVVDKFTAESVLQGAHVYAPGIVKCQKTRRDQKVTVVDDQGQPVASGITRMSETEILKYRHGLAVEVTSSRYEVPSLRETDEFQCGLMYPQSFPAILTSRILDPQCDEEVVDLNCAPGGKLSHISGLMRNTGRVIGVDRNRQKISTARETIKRLGCSNVTLLAHDARYFDVDFPKVKADRCIVDPPCSALGIMPKLYEYTSTDEILALAKYQKQFLKVASKIVKPEGVVVYSVCTTTIEECEAVVEFAVESCGLTLERQDPFFGEQGFKLYPSAELTQRFHPHKHDAGYFIARFRTAA